MFYFLLFLFLLLLSFKWNYRKSFFSGYMSSCLRRWLHLVPEHKCLGTSGKWCYFHTLRTWYVTVYIIYFLTPCQTPLWHLSLVTSTEQWIVPGTNKNGVFRGCLLSVQVQGPDLVLKHQHLLKNGCVQHVSYSCTKRERSLMSPFVQICCCFCCFLLLLRGLHRI